MLSAQRSGCINHPGVEATIRCKQCGQPVCDACMVPGSTGRFCSPACKQKHEAFMGKAQQLDGRRGGVQLVKLRGLIGTIVVVLAVLFMVGFVATKIEIPVVSNIAWRVRDMLGI